MYCDTVTWIRNLECSFWVSLGFLFPPLLASRKSSRFSLLHFPDLYRKCPALWIIKKIIYIVSVDLCLLLGVGHCMTFHYIAIFLRPLDQHCNISASLHVFPLMHIIS